ncbi:MAG: hypothetical protein LUF87_08000 [Alistipes sp.]|nr:hypothetical protein [Alistipes sp.]
MRKIAFLFIAALALCTTGCDDDNSLDLESRTKEEGGGASGAHPEGEACLAVLSAAANGWYVQCTVDGRSYKILFDFGSEGLVESNSPDLLQRQMTALCSFVSSGSDMVMKFQGQTFLNLLGGVYDETDLIVNSYSSSGVSCKGFVSGAEINFLPASASDWAELGVKSFWTPLYEKNLLNGVIQSGGDFDIHYSIDYDGGTVYFTWIEGGDAKHSLETFGFDSSYTTLQWNTVSNGSVDFSGISYDENTLNFTAVSSSSVNLYAGLTEAEVTSEFIARGTWQYEVSSGLGGYHSDLRSVFTSGVVNSVELNYRDYSTQIPVVACATNSRYLFFYNTNDGSNPIYEVDGDMVYFTFSGEYNMFNCSDQDVVEISQVMKPLTDLYFNPTGVIVVRGYGYNMANYWLIHPTDKQWVRFQRKS